MATNTQVYHEETTTVSIVPVALGLDGQPIPLHARPLNQGMTTDGRPLENRNITDARPTALTSSEGQPIDGSYNPELFPNGWDSSNPSTWSKEEKLKAAIPGTTEHKIKKDLNNFQKDENLTTNDGLHRDQNGLRNNNLNRDQNYLQDPSDPTPTHTHMTTGEKIKAAIPGTKEHKAKKVEKEAEKVEKEAENRERVQNETLDRDIRQDQGDVSHSSNNQTFGEKVKAALPGTKEHRAKKAMEKEAQPVV